MKKKSRRKQKEELVVLVYSQNPDLKHQELADLVGCHPKSLYRMAGFKKICDEQKREREVAKSALPHGSKTTRRDSYQDTADLEAWREGESDVLDCLIAQEEEAAGFDS